MGLAPRRGFVRLPPPVPTRRVPPYDEEDLIRAARLEYVRGAIEIEDFEMALDHILAGGRGCAAFPYLPMFPMPEMGYGDEGLETSGEIR